MAGSFTTNYSVGGDIDKVKSVTNVKEVDTIKEISIVKEIGAIKGFPSKSQPYNTMYCFDIPAVKQLFEFDIDLLEQSCEILALTVTCSGYGEDDNYDLILNGQKWFDGWYCTEVKEGLFLGSSTYVYAAPSNSKMRLAFRNASGTSKKVWLGVRMLIDPIEDTTVS